jgi:hypothetical protein
MPRTQADAGLARAPIGVCKRDRSAIESPVVPAKAGT